MYEFENNWPIENWKAFNGTEKYCKKNTLNVTLHKLIGSFDFPLLT